MGRHPSHATYTRILRMIYRRLKAAEDKIMCLFDLLFNGKGVLCALNYNSECWLHWGQPYSQRVIKHCCIAVPGANDVFQCSSGRVCDVRFPLSIHHADRAARLQQVPAAKGSWAPTKGSKPKPGQATLCRSLTRGSCVQVR